MQGYLIDPEARTVSVVEGGFEDYKQIQAAIGVDCFDVVRLDDLGDVAYIDDEGLLKDPEFFFRFMGGQPIAGKALVLGTDSEGETVAVNAQMTLPLLTSLITFERLKVEGFDTSEGMKEHPVLGKCWTISNEAKFSKREDE